MSRQGHFDLADLDKDGFVSYLELDSWRYLDETYQAFVNRVKDYDAWRPVGRRTRISATKIIPHNLWEREFGRTR